MRHVFLAVCILCRIVPASAFLSTAPALAEQQVFACFFFSQRVAGKADYKNLSRLRRPVNGQLGILFGISAKD